MTVCTACLFLWFYPDKSVGPAIIAASDRMLSDSGLGIEYETSRWKALTVDRTHMIFVSGELTFNSLALSRLSKLTNESNELTTLQIAEVYGGIVSGCAFERAAKRVLEPLGIPLTRVVSEGFKWSDVGLPEGLLGQVLEQLQSEQVDAEAMIIGCDGREAHLYRVDGRGIVTQHDDIGFVSIGSGGIHASGYYMQAPYRHTINYHKALLLAYFGKKRAEVAPGVGSLTDMFLITPDGASAVGEAQIAALEKALGRSQRAAARIQPTLERFIDAALQKDLAAAGTAIEP